MSTERNHGPVMTTTAITRTLKQHEEIIEFGIKSFVSVGQSLLAIRDERLYEDGYDSFDSYCKQKWGFTRQRAHQMIEAADVVSDVSTIVDTQTKKSKQKTTIPLPKNESQARALATAADTPEQRAEVWQEAVKVAPQNAAGEPVVTAKIINQVADKVVGPKNDAPKPAKPKPPAEPEVIAEPDSQFKPGFDPTTFDHEMNPDLDRKSVAKLPRDEQVIEQPKMIEAFCRSVRKFVTDNMPSDPLLDETALNIADQQLTAYLSSLRQRKAYGICPKCPEKINPKCGFCKGHGYVTKTTFESAGGVKP